ncbi:MAG: hypothetical protein L3J07_01390 [Candidatus Magasanikbacteria bacterium]|nr:hypothetical protein [Candidatus Magasanikbacteria bacterium]
MENKELKKKLSEACKKSERIRIDFSPVNLDWVEKLLRMEQRCFLTFYIGTKTILQRLKIKGGSIIEDHGMRVEITMANLFPTGFFTQQLAQYISDIS